MSSRCLSFPSAASESAIGTQRCTAPKSSTTSSAEIHIVLGPNGTSVDVAGKRAERRGPKTFLQESKTWNQLAPCGLRPGPLAFSCMAMTLYTGEALALIHSHANSFVITNDFWYVSVLVGNSNESFAGVLMCSRHDRFPCYRDRLSGRLLYLVLTRRKKT